MPFTEYRVQVAGATEAGLGPYTELQQVQTLGDGEISSAPIYAVYAIYYGRVLWYPLLYSLLCSSRCGDRGAECYGSVSLCGFACGVECAEPWTIGGPRTAGLLCSLLHFCSC